MRKKNIVVLVIFAVLVILLRWYYTRHPLATRVSVGGHIFTVDLAITNVEKQKGLGRREKLAEGQGMLFVYDHPEQYRFWMKDMQFPIDIIWIKDTTVVDIHEQVPVPQDYQLPTYTPKEPVNKVLEVNAGTVSRLGISIGDEARILKR